MEGIIYVITNKINGKQYVGQTRRSLHLRFYEHCQQQKSESSIHKAIEKYGKENFIIEELEKVELSLLNEREQYWIKKLDTYKNGYNQNIGGDRSLGTYSQIQIVELGYIADSCEELSRIMAEILDYNSAYIKNRIKRVINTDETFCDVHYKEVKADISEFTEKERILQWCKSLKITYSRKQIYCKELDKYFDSIGCASKYLVENGFYTGISNQPIKTITALISRNLQAEKPIGVLKQLSFKETYNTSINTAQSDKKKLFRKTPIYCPEIDKKFNSQVETAKYFIDNGLWMGIKETTAKDRISDVINKNIPNYKGYTFVRIDTL